MSFGSNLKKIRQDNNLTQEELAKKIKTSRSNIANYENDKNMPSIDILVKLASVFHSSVDYLIGTKTIENKKEELEKRLYHYNLTEEEYNSAICCFMNGAKKYEDLEFAIQYSPSTNDEKLEKERQVLLEISEFVSSFIPDNFINNLNEQISMIKDSKERSLAFENFYTELDRYLEKAKEFLFSLDKSKIIHNNKENIIKIPILDTVKAGYDWLAEENVIGYITDKDTVKDYEKNINEYFALQVTGDSMLPLLSKGDLVIVHDQDDVDSGQTAVVLINGEEATVKKVVKTSEGIELHAMNPYYPIKKFTFEDMKNIPVKIVGRVKEAKIKGAFE